MNCNPDTSSLSIIKTQQRESAYLRMADQLDASGECMYLYVSVCICTYCSCILLKVGISFCIGMYWCKDDDDCRVAGPCQRTGAGPVAADGAFQILILKTFD